MVRRTVDGIFYVAGTWPVDEQKPTVVFIHGSGGSHLLWEKQVAAFSNLANTIALDLPGHRRSGGQAYDNIEDYAKAVTRFIDTLNLPRPIPCGLSIGGAIALQMLIDGQIDYPGGILINTGARLKVMPVIFETIKDNYREFIGLTKVVALSEKTDPKKVEVLIKDMEQCGPEVTLSDFKACHAFDVMDKLNMVEVPVLVFTAEDDKLTPPKYGDHLVMNIPNATAVHISEAGHLLPLEQEAEVNSAIKGFLKQLGK